jgi:hypothetical protein
MAVDSISGANSPLEKPPHRIERRLTPEQVAEMLRNDPSLIDKTEFASSNQEVWLSYSNGVFVLNWSATAIGSDDWVGLYTSVAAADSDYIKGAWQFAKSGNSFRTSQVLISGYQARYLVWDSSRSAYVSVVRTDPFPYIRICSV